MRQIIELNSGDVSLLKKEGLTLVVGGHEIALTYFRRALRPSEEKKNSTKRKYKYATCTICKKRYKKIGMYLHMRQAHGRK
jgi:hypothetical protein